MIRLALPRAAAGLLVALAATGCDERRPRPEGLAAFAVEVDGGLGSPTERLPVPRGVSSLRVRAQAFGHDGEPLAWNGVAVVKVTPGRTVPGAIDCSGDAPEPPCMRLVDGVGEIEVSVLGVHSDTQVWVVDDTAEGEEATYAVGIGGPIHFGQPTLADANQIPPNGDNAESAYPGDFVEMTREDDPSTGAHLRRDLIVTAIFNDGFYVTDLAEAAATTLPGNFGSLFVFNFSYPEDLLVGDRIEHLQGTLLDFSGNTQLAFPDWRRDAGGPYPDELAQLLANPPAIAQETCTGGSSSFASLELCGYSSSNLQLESLESSIVSVPTVKLPDLWVRCDLDGNGEIAPFRQEGSGFVCNAGDEECACNLACLTSTAFASESQPDRSFDATGMVCSELTNYQTYGQYAVRLLEAGVVGSRINLASRDAIPDFDPLAPEASGLEVRARGVLRHVRAARPRWVILTRQSDDLCCTGAGCASGLLPCAP